MKKSYEKPITQIVMAQHSANLLQTSGKFTDSAPSGGWNEGGANANESDDDTWEDDE